MVSHISPSSRIGYNGGDDSPTFLLDRHKKNRPKGSHKVWRVPTYKTVNKKYGELSSKLAEKIPWNKLCVDIMAPYKYTENREIL